MIHKSKKNTLTIFLIFIILLGCETMESRWRDAQSKNTVEAYKKFIKDYPESHFIDEAKKIIIQLEFEKAKSAHTMQAYEGFVERFPESPHSNEAQSKIMELRYKAAKQRNTTKHYKKFIKQYPQSSYADDAQTEILGILAKKLKDCKSYEDKEKIENLMINEIAKNGVGNSFKIESIRPFEDDYSGSVAVKPGLISTLYPKDKIVAAPDMSSGLSPMLPFGDMSIWRFIGEIKFSEDYVFIGYEQEPLTFMLLKGVGFVYIHGKGSVEKNESIITTLP